MADLEKTRYVRELLAAATSGSHLQIQPAFSQYLESMAGEGWLAVGDEAFTLDPLSSSGIYKALVSGIRAAEAITQQAKANNIPVVIDGGSWKPGFEKVLPFVDFLSIFRSSPVDATR